MKKQLLLISVLLVIQSIAQRKIRVMKVRLSIVAKVVKTISCITIIFLFIQCDFNKENSKNNILSTSTEEAKTDKKWTNNKISDSLDNYLVKEETVIGSSGWKHNLLEWKNAVSTSGDEKAYELLLEYTWLNDNSCEVYEHSKLMADKYNYPKAYYEVFICLAGYSNSIPIRYIKEIKTKGEKREEAIKYLKKSNELGYKRATDLVKKLNLEKE